MKDSVVGLLEPPYVGFENVGIVIIKTDTRLNVYSLNLTCYIFF